jgi:hypothetical protein
MVMVIQYYCRPKKITNVQNQFKKSGILIYYLAVQCTNTYHGLPLLFCRLSGRNLRIVYFRDS